MKDLIIEKFSLTPHPEGGHYSETYRSTEIAQTDSLPENMQGQRSFSTGIYFLLEANQISHLHRIKSDEMWHFYDGAPIRLHIISKEGAYSNHVIGRNVLEGQVPQLVVQGGDWFAAEVIDDNTYAFVGCTVAPGFDFKDFVLPDRKELIELFPEHTEIITRLTR